MSLYAASLTERPRGHHAKGPVLAPAGLTAVGAGGAPGGHLAYRQAAGAGHAEAVPRLVSPGRHRIGPGVGFPASRATRAAVDGVDSGVVRKDCGQVHILADRCAAPTRPARAVRR
ncbi:hypothetical protein ACF1E9_14790 [Streptomyces roseolus]|uniref:hypothetical protein n=1 Tax=Streptomyces roseolus TaxID=67358 RepID=UPI0036FB9B7F